MKKYWPWLVIVPGGLLIAFAVWWFFIRRKENSFGQSVPIGYATPGGGGSSSLVSGLLNPYRQQGGSSGGGGGGGLSPIQAAQGLTQTGILSLLVSGIKGIYNWFNPGQYGGFQTYADYYSDVTKNEFAKNGGGIIQDVRDWFSGSNNSAGSISAGQQTNWMNEFYGGADSQGLQWDGANWSQGSGYDDGLGGGGDWGGWDAGNDWSSADAFNSGGYDFAGDWGGDWGGADFQSATGNYA